ncbi:hypothetical protein [Teredinibacter haidensis]|uniref:hypothetical protein n=1 Tax=Teredinibacter haidensis TaxID=2731755 RepID=UPI0009488A83|nr:hypothetical protein [Teredinibacter haidensis]
MNVTINGYVNYICNSCSQSYTVEGNIFSFNEDTSPESEDDEYIRYISHFNTPCASCSNKILFKLDVWEHPAAVANYSYYSVEGVSDIQCEFTIEHYFDTEVSGADNNQYEPEPEAVSEDELDEDEDENYDDIAPIESYTDNYDDEDEY